MSGMGRREFVALLGGAAAAWPLAVGAQQAGKVRRIGFLRVGAPPPSFIGPLQKALKDLGYVEGKNFVFEYGLAKSVAELPNLAVDLVRRRVDVLVASGTPAVIPARNATTTIPVVFIAAMDPVATGVVTSSRAAGRKRHRIDCDFFRPDRQAAGASQGDAALAHARCAALAPGQPGPFSICRPGLDGSANFARRAGGHGGEQP